jgi:hypothetical protein
VGATGRASLSSISSGGGIHVIVGAAALILGFFDLVVGTAILVCVFFNVVVGGGIGTGVGTATLVPVLVFVAVVLIVIVFVVVIFFVVIFFVVIFIIVVVLAIIVLAVVVLAALVFIVVPPLFSLLSVTLTNFNIHSIIKHPGIVHTTQ